MLSNKKHGFTLVELLAVIIILAVILVIAVPKVMDIINDTKKSTFANSVKLIALGAEKKYAENKVLGSTNQISCEDVAKLSNKDYKLCEIAFEKEEARVTVIGDGKFEGLSVVYATKTNAEVQTGEPERLYTFDEVYNLIDNINQRIDKIESNGTNNEEIENLKNQINDLTNKENSNNLFLKMYPVGSVYVTNESTNPGSIFGGTWVSFGAGRTLVGVDSSQEEFSTVEFIGGEKEHILTIDEMPKHNHTYATPPRIYDEITSTINYLAEKSSASQSYTRYTSYTGGSLPHNNLQPYITVYMWKRTA